MNTLIEAETFETARRLLGSEYWNTLPDFGRAGAAGLLPVLLALPIADARLEGIGAGWLANDYAYEWLPFYRSDVLALLAGLDLNNVADIAGLCADDFGSTGIFELAELPVQVLASIFCSMCYRLTEVESNQVLVECWNALGLEGSSIEVAIKLLPQWSGTIAELIAAASV